MKLNKTLTMMKELNDNGSAYTINSREEFDKIMNFKAITNANIFSDTITFGVNNECEVIEAKWQGWDINEVTSIKY